MVGKSLVVVLAHICIVHAFLSPVIHNLRTPFRLKRQARPSSPTSIVDEQQPTTTIGHQTERDDYMHKLTSWTKRGSLDETIKVQRILDRLEEEDISKSLSFRHLNVAIEAWGKLGRIDKAESIVQKMTSPDRASYSAVMHANIRCGNLQRAEELLELMESSKHDRVHPVTSDYNLLLTTYARKGEAQKAESLLKRMVDRCRRKEEELGYYQDSMGFSPDLMSYNLVLDAHAKSDKPGAGERAMDILRELNHHYDGGELSFRPNHRTYSAVMQAVIRCDDSNDKAIDVVKALIEESSARGVKTDFLQSMVLSSYASCSEPEAAEKAEALLEDFEREGTAGIVAYNTCLKAWKSSASANATKGAEKIIRRMEKRQCVDTVSYTTMIGILAKKGDKASAHRAQEILSHMQESCSNGKEAVKPNSQTYNSVLLALVRCGNIQRAEQLLGQMEALLENDGQPDCGPTVVSYSTVMSG